MAAKALILSAFISLLAQRQMASTHMSRKPMARRPMYMNSLTTESHRTPGRGHKRLDGVCQHVGVPYFPLCVVFTPTLRLPGGQLDETATLFFLVFA